MHEIRSGGSTDQHPRAWRQSRWVVALSVLSSNLCASSTQLDMLRLAQDLPKYIRLILRDVCGVAAESNGHGHLLSPMEDAMKRQPSGILTKGKLKQ